MQQQLRQSHFKADAAVDQVLQVAVGIYIFSYGSSQHFKRIADAFLQLTNPSLNEYTTTSAIWVREYTTCSMSGFYDSWKETHRLKTSCITFALSANGSQSLVYPVQILHSCPIPSQMGYKRKVITISSKGWYSSRISCQNSQWTQSNS